MIVRLKQRSSRYPDLSPRQPYVVIGIEADQFRILNDAGRPYLYPPRVFACVDSREPDDWVEVRGDDGERYAYPSAIGKPGFFEDLPGTPGSGSSALCAILGPLVTGEGAS